MRFKLGSTVLGANYGFAFALFLILFFAKNSLMPLYLFTASLLHEAGHYAAALLCGRKVSEICLCFCGMKMTVPAHSKGYFADAVIRLCGPAVNLLLAFVSEVTAGSNEFISVNLSLFFFNLLPLYSLDGGGALYAMLCTRLNEKNAKTVITCVSFITVIPLTVVGAFIFLKSRKSFTILAAGVYLLVLLLKEK